MNTTEVIITDSGKKFIDPLFEETCSKHDIEHKVAGIEDHVYNGKVEQVIRILRTV